MKLLADVIFADGARETVSIEVRDADMVLNDPTGDTGRMLAWFGAIGEHIKAHGPVTRYMPHYRVRDDDYLPDNRLSRSLRRAS